MLRKGKRISIITFTFYVLSSIEIAQKKQKNRLVRIEDLLMHCQVERDQLMVILQYKSATQRKMIVVRKLAS